MEKHQFNLVEGTFDAHETKQVLTNLINSKINYHALDKFSKEERFGKVDTFSVTRIEELNKSIDSLASFLNETASDNSIFEITGTIQIRLKK
jgi:hypothetical protein